MNTDIAVNSAKIDALQKSQDTWTTNLKDDIRRVETSLATRLAEIARIIDGLVGKGPVSPKKE